MSRASFSDRAPGAPGAPASAAKDRAGAGRPSKAPSKAASKRPSKRRIGASERRAAIVAAGLDEFTARGFAATRLDDVARRAGVAKGTIYLHFKDKEALFEELVRTALGPLIARLADPPTGEGSAREAVQALADLFVLEVVGTRRGDLLRMVVAEGGRFPALADFYHREVVAHGLAGMRKLIEHGIARGEIRNPQIVAFPQLVIAPLVVAVIWQGLFRTQAPLDTAAMLRVHLDLIFTDGRTA
jgi:AcrR family transcriptional regulator